MPSRSDLAAQRGGLLLLLVLGPLLGGALSLWLGQDSNWDLRNYHWYNAYAFMTGRGDMDVAPAQVATFYNPTLDLPFFWLAQALPARAVGFIMGAVQGLNLVPLAGLAWTVLAAAFPATGGRARALAAGLVALAGFLGGGQVGLIGTTFYDNVISLLVLGSAWIVAAGPGTLFGASGGRAFALVAAAGFLVGSAVGLKQPTLPFAVGLCFAFLFVAEGPWLRSFPRRFLLSFVFGLGVLAGMALFSGHWMLHLWTEYRNPLFPYFNDIFQSPWGVAEPYRDDKFVPKSAAEALAFPFLWVADPSEVGEILFRDLRIPVAYVLLPLTGLLLAGRALAARLGRAGQGKAGQGKAGQGGAGQGGAGVPWAASYLLVAAALGYLVWLKLFGIYRYLVPLEMLAPVLIVAAAALWPVPTRARAALAAVLLVLVAVTARPGNWSRIAWTDRFVEVQAPDLPRPDDTIVLQAGYAPTSFLSYGFPPQVPFLRLQSYFIHPDHGGILLNRRMAERIAAHQGDFYLLVAHWETWTADSILPRYGLHADMDDCRPVTSNLDEPMMLCRVYKDTAAPAPGAAQPG
ncbi:hypothetical protein [Rhodocista pekingensis]|uniref:Glycosyltransferase RgtA/B/C/D-like domain-containing protein n=1 Tax=Rhodocista pekingensis TaxID=201185 RepID=A0ABW2KWF9_9PROT